MTGRFAAGARADRGEVAALAAVTTGWAVLRHALPSSMDLVLSDETVSHGAAWALLHRGELSLSPEASPLYLVWCAVWQLLCGGDVAVAYFAQWLATDLLLALAVLAVLRRAGLPRAVATAGALFWLSLGVVTLGWPRVSFFALLVALAGVLAHSERRWYALPAALALATLVRPEFALPLAAFVAARLAGRWRLAWRVAAAAAAVTALTASAVYASPRLWFAFSQHYAMISAPAGVDFWREYESVTGAVFPGARTVAEAAVVNPAAMAAHVGGNLSRVLVVIADGLWGRPQGFGAAPGVLLLLVVLALGLLPRRGWPGPDTRVVAALGWLLPALVPSLVVLPKAIYSLPALLLGVLAVASCVHRAGAWLAERQPAWSRARPALLAVAAAVGLAACWRLSPLPRPRPVLQTVSVLRAVHAAQGRPPWRLLENDIGWCVYIGQDRCQQLLLTDYTDSTVRAVLDAAAPDAVFVSRTWRSRRTLAADPELGRLVDAPGELGFHRAAVTEAGILLLRGLPPAPPPGAISPR